MNDMRHYINIIEDARAEAELLNEGPVGKALATAALALGLNFAQQANAAEVFVYQDAQGELQTVSSYMQVPDNTPLSYVIDTDTQKVKYLKRPEPTKIKKPTPAEVTQLVTNPDIKQIDEPTEIVSTDAGSTKGKQLVGKLVSGMSIEQVRELYPDAIDGGDGIDGKSVVTKTGMGNHSNVKLYLKKSLIGEQTGKAKGRTFFEFNSNNQLVGVYISTVLAKEFKPVRQGQGFWGFDINEVPKVMKRTAQIIPKEFIGDITSKVQIHKQGEFGLNFGMSKLAKVGGDLGGIGLGFSMDKTGSAYSTVTTSKGQFSILHSTQTGMVNTFRPYLAIVGIKDMNMLSSQDKAFSFENRIVF